MSDTLVAESSLKPRHPKGWIAGPISLLIPGLGHLYLQRSKLAVLIMVLGQAALPVVGILVAVELFSFAVFIFWMLASIGIPLTVAVHAFIAARRTAPFQPRWWSRWYGLVLAAVLYVSAGMVAVFFYDDPINSFYIPANSMQPTVQEGDRLIAVALYGKPVRRGDIIVFNSEAVGGTDYIKRVVALGGDSVELRDNRLLVNGQEVPVEPGGTRRIGWQDFTVLTETLDGHRHEIQVMNGGSRGSNFGPKTVPANHVFVLGDNRDNSLDSRFVGAVRVEDIHWRPAHVFWSRNKDRIGLDLRTR